METLFGCHPHTLSNKQIDPAKVMTGSKNSIIRGQIMIELPKSYTIDTIHHKVYGCVFKSYKK